MAKTTPRRRGLTAREQFWRGHLRKIEAMGIGTKAYAGRCGLSVHALYQARKQLVALGAWPERKVAAATAPVFAPVRVIDGPGADPAWRVRLASGTVLEWRAAPAPEVLAVLLDRLASLPR